MSKPSANSLSLASLFTLTTAVAVVVWVVMYAPVLLCCLVIVALPAMLRLGEFLQTAEQVNHTLTLTEILVGFVGASILSGLAMISLFCAIFSVLSIGIYLPDQAEPRLVVFLLILLGTWPVLGCCCYFLLGEVWIFPTRFAGAYGRLPNYREQIAQVFKAISLNVFVFSGCASVVFIFLRVIPGSYRTIAWSLGFALALSATAAAAYLLAWFHFHRGWVRALAGFGWAGIFGNVVLRVEKDPAELIVAGWWGGIASLFIALPFFRWPPTPSRPEPPTPEILPPADTTG